MVDQEKRRRCRFDSAVRSVHFRTAPRCLLVQSIFRGAEDIAYHLSPYLETFYTDSQFLKEYEAYTELSRTPDALVPLSDTVCPFASLVFDHVSFAYPGTETLILKDVSFTLTAGKHYALVGLNGSGKSTIIKLILKFYDNYTGNILLNGRSIREWSLSDIKGMMGAVFQDFRLIPTMTVYENVAFAMRVTNINNKTIKNRVPFALSLVGLEDKMDRLPDELSGGEQQRVAVARALAHGPKLIIADEPTGNIDPEMSMDIMQLFEAINKVHITVVVVTHEHELVHKLAAKYNNRIITLANGHVASDTAHPEVAQEYEEWLAARQNDDEYEYED